MPPSAPPERPKHVKPKKVARPKKPKEPKAAANLQQTPVNIENPGAQPRPASNTEGVKHFICFQLILIAAEIIISEVLRYTDLEEPRTCTL